MTLCIVISMLLIIFVTLYVCSVKIRASSVHRIPKSPLLSMFLATRLYFGCKMHFFVYLTSKQCPIPKLQDVTDINFNSVLKQWRSRDSVVGITTSYGLGDREVGVRVPVGSRIFSSPNDPDRL
jgi:hypothetical protein